MKPTTNKAAREPYYLRPELHVAWVSLPVAVVLGAGTWLGGTNFIIPLAFVAIAWATLVVYVFVMLPVRIMWRCAIAIAATVSLTAVGWAFWDLFTVDAKIRFINGGLRDGLGEELSFAMELTNNGKPTSLRYWRARLITSTGQVYEREPLHLSGKEVKITDANRNVQTYALPDCDLIFEPARALQTGDTVYGVVEFLFRNYQASELPQDIKVRLTATDILGRTIRTTEASVSEISKQPGEVFACRTRE